MFSFIFENFNFLDGKEPKRNIKRQIKQQQRIKNNFFLSNYKSVSFGILITQNKRYGKILNLFQKKNK